jgi:flavin-dependent dehydrogenase
VYYGSWTGLDGGFEFHERVGSWIAAIPTNDGETVVAAYFPQEEFAQVRLDPQAALHAAVAHTAPGLARRMAAARPVGKLKGSGAQENFFRVPAGPGWALIGDAGHHKDSITARGITDGLTQAQLLADALSADVGDETALDAALAGFHRGRDDALTAAYESTLSVADLAISPGRLQMLRTISGSAQLCTRYFAVVAGLASMQDLLTDDLLALL